jgi:hypothetical protein
LDDAKRKATKEHEAWLERESAERKAGKFPEYRESARSLPRWCVLAGESQYRCYAATEAHLCLLQRKDVWVAHPFPESTCCGLKLTNPDEYHAHMKSWRHYTFSAFADPEEETDVNAVYIDIDPRMVDGQAAFDALPKRVAFKRMQRYVDYMNEKLELRRDPDTWSDRERQNMDDIVKSVNANFANRSPSQYDDTDSGECAIELSVQDVVDIIVGHALDTFKSDGPLGEVHGVPYLTVDDLAHVGLIALDPFGGSSSARTFMETLYQG